jgi:hypothetical protein
MYTDIFPRDLHPKMDPVKMEIDNMIKISDLQDRRINQTGDCPSDSGQDKLHTYC